MTEDQHHPHSGQPTDNTTPRKPAKPTNRRATWGAVLAVPVWPVGLVLSFLGYRRAGVAGYGRRRAIGGMIAAGLVCAFSLGQAASGSDSPASASSAATGTDSAAQTAVPAPSPSGPLMKDWTGQSVAAAEDAIIGPASRLIREDAGIDDRYVSNNGWVVCRQSIPAGAPFEDQEVTLVAVKIGEKCISEQERADQITARDQQKAAEDAAAQAQRDAERAAREAEAARVPVLDNAARSACAVLAAGAADVATKQDRSDLARAFNAYARQSSEAKIVQDGQNLTNGVDSWTGFMWDGAVAIAAEDCLKGGAAG